MGPSAHWSRSASPTGTCLTRGSRWAPMPISTAPLKLGLDAHSLDVDPKFVNPAGPDGLLGFSDQAVGSPTILDDSSPTGVTFTGNWTTQYTGGYNGESAVSDGTNGDVATYTFAGLTPGSYVQVAVTWPAHPSSNTPFSTSSMAAASSHGQRRSDPGAPTRATPRQPGSLSALIYVTGSTLQVEIAQKSYYNFNYPAVADAVASSRFRVTRRRRQLPRASGHRRSMPAIPLRSPTIEPLPNGGRINLGFDGNTGPLSSGGSINVVRQTRPRPRPVPLR